MKRMMLLTAIFLFSGLVPSSLVCAASEPELRADNIEYELRENPYWDNYLFDYRFDVINESDVGVMDISYTIHFVGHGGEALAAFSRSFNAQDTPIAPGETISLDSSGYFESGITPETIEKAEVIFDKVISEEEMPPAVLPKEGEYLYLSLNDPHLEKIKEEPPVEINLWIDEEGMRSVANVTDEETIAALTEAFTKAKIGEKTDEWATDSYNGIAMTFEDGERSSVGLNVKNLEISVYGVSHSYRLDDFEEFWGLMNSLAAPVEDEPYDDA